MTLLTGTKRHSKNIPTAQSCLLFDTYSSGHQRYLSPTGRHSTNHSSPIATSSFKVELKARGKQTAICEVSCYSGVCQGWLLWFPRLSLIGCFATRSTSKLTYATKHITACAKPRIPKAQYSVHSTTFLTTCPNRHGNCSLQLWKSQSPILAGILIKFLK